MNHPPNFYLAAPPNPSALAGLTTAKMAGIGVQNSFTPQRSNACLVVVSGDVTASANTATLQIQYGVTSPPANAATPTGSPSPMGLITSASTAAVPFVLQGIVTNLGVGVGYWFDIAGSISGAGGTLTLTNLTVSVVEL
jgi:hypothetical protein